MQTCGGKNENDNGNGSLMRIMPVCLYFYEKQKIDNLDDAEVIEKIHAVSALTHAHQRSKIACGLYYGYDEIPEEWLEVIQRREWIEELCKLSEEKI